MNAAIRSSINHLRSQTLNNKKQLINCNLYKCLHEYEQCFLLRSVTGYFSTKSLKIILAKNFTSKFHW